MNKRQRLEAAIAGEALDRVPVCLWRHWPGDDQRSADLARAVVQFQSAYDWDFVVIGASPNFSLTGYGLQDAYEGDLAGERTTLRFPVRRSLEWTELRPLDPGRGDLARQADCVGLVGQALEPAEVPFVHILYSPLSQAMRLAGRDVVIRSLRTQPERLHSGLNVLTDTTLRFVEALRRSPLSGVYYIMEDACYDALAEDEYRRFGLPYDQKILSSLPNRWWLRVGLLRGQNPMLGLMRDLPLNVVSWQAHDGRPDIGKGRNVVSGAVMTGLNRRAQLHDGTPLSIADACRQALIATNGRMTILSCDGPMLLTTPLSNILAVRSAVQASVK
jgi:uroporphyrinogen decarboxylase